MRRCLRAIVILGALLPTVSKEPVAGPVQSGSAKQVETDPHGDPLPPGAFARLGTERLRHSTQVNALAFSSQGKILLSAGESQDVRLWEVATGKELRRLSAPARTMSLSPDGAFLA